MASLVLLFSRVILTKVVAKNNQQKYHSMVHWHILQHSLGHVFIARAIN